MRVRSSFEGSLVVRVARLTAVPLAVIAAPGCHTSAASSPKTAAAAGSTSPTSSTIPDAVLSLQRAALASTAAADVVRSLTTEVGARLGGSQGDRKAVAWALETMRTRGLDEVHAEPVTVPRWTRGEERAKVVDPVAQSLAITALGGSVSTPPGGLEAEVVELGTLEELENADAARIAGKIVFVNRPMRRARDGAGYGEAIAVRTFAALYASKKGAVAALVRSIGTDHDRFPHTGAQKRDPGDHPIPAASLSVPDAELVHDVIARHGHARISLTIGAHHDGEAQSANVIGDVRGRERPEEIVLLGAHLDSWDLGTGAVDDGAGCGIVLEAGRLLAALKVKPRRTVRIVLFAAEENALAGGREYARAHASEAKSHVVALEADSGTDRVYEAKILGGTEAGVQDRFLALASRLGPLTVAASREDARGGADISPLRALGVPVVDLEQDFSRYFDLHHTANDTFDKIDAAALAQAAAAYATMAWSIAEMDSDFARVPEGKRESRP